MLRGYFAVMHLSDRVWLLCYGADLAMHLHDRVWFLCYRGYLVKHVCVVITRGITRLCRSITICIT